MAVSGNESGEVCLRYERGDLVTESPVTVEIQREGDWSQIRLDTAEQQYRSYHSLQLKQSHSNSLCSLSLRLISIGKERNKTILNKNFDTLICWWL